MKLSIRMKIFLPVMFLLIAFPLAAWFVFSYALDGHMNYNAKRDLGQMVKTVEELSGEYSNLDVPDESDAKDDRGSLLNALKNAAQTESGESKMLVIGKNYRVLYPKNYDDQPEMTQMYSEFLTRMTGNDPAFESGEITEETIGETKYMLYFLDVGQNRPGRVQNVLLYCPIHDTSVILKEVSRLVLMIMGAMAGVSIVLFWFVAGSISDPVSRLCEAARGIGEKKFKRVETGTNVKELYELENEINQMQDNLLKADEAERVFFQNASHELRTPLMSISGYAQGIQRGVFEDAFQAAGVILDESSRLTEVVDGILTLTRMDQMRYQVVPVELGIREYIEDQIERLEGLAYQKKIKLEFLSGDEHKIISDVMLLGRAFSNVTSNCIRYAKETVQISVEAAGDRLKITIRDDGPGISEADLPHLFDRFYKGKNGNHGLGLSIAKRSMEYMGGNIEAESSPEGAIFMIILPQDCRSFAVEEWTEV
mgnify:FL=1